MDYETAVAAAAGALQRGDEADWELARLTWEHTRSGRGSDSQPGRVPIDQWCADVRAASGRRFSARTGHLFKRAWEFRRSAEFADQTLNEVLRELQPTSYDPETVQARVDASAVEKHLRNGLPAEKAETLARLLADPTVLELAVPFGSPLSRALADAIDTQRALREERVERLIEADPISQRQRNATSLTQITGLLSRFAEDIAARLPHVRELPDPANDPTAQMVFLREALVRAESAIASVKALLSTGRVGGDVDQFVRGVLSEQER